MMEKINTHGAHRFTFPSNGWAALLMLASALVGAAAGHAFGATQPAVAAPATAPVLTQVEPGQSTATGSASERNELRQVIHDLRLAQSLRSRGTQSQPVPFAAASDASSQNDLRWQMNALRQARQSLQSATAISVDAANLSESARIEIPAANPYLSNDARHPER
jgi:hypothetical protein